MSNLEYIFSLNDQVSAKLGSINVSSEKTLDTFGKLQLKSHQLNLRFEETGDTLSHLRAKVGLLKAEREWIPADNADGLKAYNSEINKLTSRIDKLKNLKDVGFRDWLEGVSSYVPGLKMVLNPTQLITEATTRLSQILKTGVAAWNAETEAHAKLAVAMRGTMQAGKAEANGIIELAVAQEKLGVINRKVQYAGAGELAGYLTRCDSMKKMLPLMNDMLAEQYGLNATQEQATGVAKALGQAMTGEIASISGLGYTFTEAQENVLKFGKETERATVLAEVIGKSVRGVNEALAQTPEGKWKQHENDMDRLMVRIGKVYQQFRTAMFPVIEFFGNLFGQVVAWIESNSNTIVAVISGLSAIVTQSLGVVYDVLSGIAGGFVWWYTALRDGNPYITGLTATIATLAAGFSVLYAVQNRSLILSKALTVWQGIQAAATKGLTFVQNALSIAFANSPLGLVALAIGVVVGAVTVCWNKFEKFRKGVFSLWNVVKEFGKALFNAIVEPIRNIIQGLGAIGEAVGKLTDGDFEGAWESAKEGAKNIASGVMEAIPVGVAVNVVKNGNWAEAWEKGQQEGADSWAQSQEAGSQPDLMDFSAGMPEFSMPQFSDLSDLAGLAPPAVSISPSIPAMTQPAGVIDLPEPAYKPEKENYLSDIMLNVRKIAAATVLPFALSVATPSDVQATVQPDLSITGGIGGYQFQNTSGSGKHIAIDRVCDQIVIHVQNTDNRGREEIRAAIFEVLNEIAE